MTSQLQFLTAVVGNDSCLMDIIALSLETIAHRQCPLTSHIDGSLCAVVPRIGAAGLVVSVPREIGVVSIKVKDKSAGSLIMYAAVYAAFVSDAGIFSERTAVI